MSNFLKNAVLSLFGLAAACLALEAAVRVVVDDGMQYELEMWKYALEAKRVSANEDIGHEHVPGAGARLMGVDVAINDIGLRDDPVAVPKPDGTVRVLFLGDSITFGWGVPDEDRVSERVESALNSDPGLPGTRVEVINAGVGNYNAAMSVAWYLEHGAELEPDVIVFNYFINDAEPIPRRQGGWLRENSAAFVLISGMVDSLLRRTQERQDWRDYYRALYSPDSRARDDMILALNDLNIVTRADGIPVLFAIYPELRELDPYPFQDITDWLARQTQPFGWITVDLLGSVADVSPESLWVTVPDPHPNAEANAHFADALLPPLRGIIVNQH